MANEDAGRKRQVSATDQNRARATGSRKPGVVDRMMDQCRESVESIRLPRADWRTFAWGLLLVIFVIFIVRNWAPVRINLFGWYVDAPRAVVLAIFFALGMVTTWLIEIRNRRARAAGQPADEIEPDEEELLATEIPPEEFEPSPEDFATDTEASASEFEESEAEVLPEPKEFAEEDASSDDSDIAHFDEPLTGEDETAGDALSQEYGFREPAEIAEGDEPRADDADRVSDEDPDDDQDTVTDDSDEESSDEDDSRSPFWRM